MKRAITFYNEEGEYILSENLRKLRGGRWRGAFEGVSNPSAPAPLEDDTDPIEGNDMESEGITNEEAGLNNVLSHTPAGEGHIIVMTLPCRGFYEKKTGHSTEKRSGLYLPSAPCFCWDFRDG